MKRPFKPGRAFFAVALGLISLVAPSASAQKHQTLQPTPLGTPASLLGTPASPLLKATTPKLPAYVPGEVIVRFKAGVSESAQAAVHARLKAKVVRHLLLSRTVLVKLDGKRNEKAAAATYERQSAVSLAQPNFIRHLDATFPNDPSFSEQWGLNNTGQSVSGIPSGTSDADIDAPEAWDQTTGSSAVTVAVVDSGVDVSHPDLAGRAVAGYDFVDNDATPQDPEGHGTAMAGIIGAAGNDGAGITGVNWNVRIMPLRVCDATQGCTDQRIADAFSFAAANGVKVVNASLSGPGVGAVVESAIASAGSTLFVVSAGNGGADGQGDNNAASHEYPCDFTVSNIVCVTSTNQSDQLTGFANYSSTSVDIAAPGLDILSDWPGGQLAYLNGTSASTAYTSGVAALALAVRPSTAIGPGVLPFVLNGDTKTALVGKTVTGMRLNPGAAVATPPAQAPGELDSSFNGGSLVMTDFSGNFGDGKGAAIQSDGKIVMAGNTSNDIGVARYNTDGTLDNTFGSQGKVITDLGGPSSDDARAVAIDPTSGKIVVGGQSDGGANWAVLRYNANGTLDTSFDGDGKLILPDVGVVLALAVQDDGKIVLAGEQNLGFYQIDFKLKRINSDGTPDSGFGSGGVVTTDFAGSDFPLDVKVQNDGKIVAAGASRAGESNFGSSGDFAVARYNANGTLDTGFDGDGKVRTDFGTARAHAVAPQSDGKIVAAGYSRSIINGKIFFTSFRDGNGEIYSMNPDGTGATNLTNNPAVDASPSVSPDGSKIAFTSNRDGDDEIYTMNADGTGVSQLTNNPSADEDPTWSPDGNFIAFRSTRDGVEEIYRMYADGFNPIALTTNSFVDGGPDWSPDGTKIAFWTDRGGNSEIYTLDFNNGAGGNETNLTNNSADDFSPKWSPDGTKIVFDTNRDGNREIYVMNADGTGQVDLTNNPASDTRPSVSPDGSKLAFVSTRDANAEIYTMNANGSSQTNITNNAADDRIPAWQPQQGNANFALTRYNANGSLDTSFDGDGKLVTTFATAAEANDVIVQNNPSLAAYKKITAVGTMWAGGPLGNPPSEFAVARYNPNGSLDTTFDGDGRVITTSSGEGNAAAAQSDGNILVAGTTSSRFGLARYISGQLGVFAGPNSELNPAGDSVNLIISGYEPNDVVQIQQCREGAPSGNVCALLAQVTLNSSGGFGTGINVNYTVQGLAPTCEDPYCAVRVTSTTSGQTKSTPISFRQPATLTATPSAGQIAQNQAITLGQSVTDSAFVQGNAKGGTPSGTVSFFWCGPVDFPETCRAGTQIGSAVTLTAGVANSATASSASFTPAGTGRYCLRAAYSGDNKYRPATDAGSANCIYVRPTAATFAAVDDPYTAFKNFSFSQPASGLLQNDVHPGPISVVPFSGATAQGGTVMIASNGSFTYVPATNFTGPDTFTYTATDGGVQTDTATVRLEVTALDPLEYTKYRYTKYRYTKYRDIAQAQLTVYAFCGPRLVSINPQVTLFEPTLIALSAALYDAAGNRLLTTPGYLAYGEFGGDPFQPNTLAWPDWTTVAPAGGAHVEVLLEADFDTAAPYTERVTAPCAT